MFRFRSKNKSPVYLIGSANFSNSAFAQNDEAMVVIKRVHPGLQDYIEHVIRTSASIEELPPETAARTWRDFLRNAYLYYRPSRAVSFAIDPFKDEEFRDIARRLRETIFNPPPFGERNVLGLNIAALLQLEIENTRVGFRMPTYSIETNYGYWVPKAYVDFIDEMLEESLGPRLRALEQRGFELQQAGDKFVLLVALLLVLFSHPDYFSKNLHVVAIALGFRVDFLLRFGELLDLLFDVLNADLPT